MFMFFYDSEILIPALVPHLQLMFLYLPSQPLFIPFDEDIFNFNRFMLTDKRVENLIANKGYIKEENKFE